MNKVQEQNEISDEAPVSNEKSTLAAASTDPAFNARDAVIKEAGTKDKSALSILEEALENPEPVLIGFGASWCGPWSLLQPVLASIEKKGSPVLKIDVDKDPEIADKFVVVTLPTFVVMKNKEETRRWLGAVSESELEAGLIAKTAGRSNMRRRR